MLQDDTSQLRLAIQVEYELCITDDPFVATYDENCSYVFDGVFLQVSDRRMMPEVGSGGYLNPETAEPRTVGRVRLPLTTLSEVEALVAMLTWAPELRIW